MFHENIFAKDGTNVESSHSIGQPVTFLLQCVYSIPGLSKSDFSWTVWQQGRFFFKHIRSCLPSYTATDVPYLSMPCAYNCVPERKSFIAQGTCIWQAFWSPFCPSTSTYYLLL